MVFSPCGPSLVMVSATVDRLIDPSFRIFKRNGIATAAADWPAEAKDMQAAFLTFRYSSFSKYNSSEVTLADSTPSRPIAHAAIVRI